MNLRWLQSLSETDLHVLVEDLLRAMGYQQVTVTHGPLEKGRDVVFLEVDRAKRQIWRGVQVKSMPVSGRLSSETGLRPVMIQLEAALELEYLLPNGEKVMLTEMWLITPFPLSENAEQSAETKLRTSKRMQIFDGPALADLVATYLPQLDQMGSKPIEDYLSRLLEFCDSPEEYLSTRMQTKYAISDIYIPPICRVYLATESSVVASASLAVTLGLSDLRHRLTTLIPLMSNRILPLYRLRLLLHQLRHLFELAEAVASCVWYKRSNVLAEHLRSLNDLLELPESYMTADNATELHRQFSASASMEYLMGLSLNRYPRQSASIDEVREFQELYRGNPGRFVKFSEAFPDLDLTVQDAFTLLEGFVECAELERALYGTLTNTASQEIRISQAKRLIAEMTLFAEDFDSALRAHFLSLWGNFVEDYKNQFNTEDSKSIGRLAELCDLTSLITKFHGLTSMESFSFDAVSLVGNTPRVLCLGNLGMGKTILLKRVCAAWAETAKHSGGALVPIFCSLSAVRNKDMPLDELLLAAAHRTKEYSTKLAQTNKSWALDGFDEIDSINLKNQILKWCQSREPVGRLALSSRPSAVQEDLRGFLKIHLQPFSEQQIRAYIERFPWFDKNQSKRMQGVLFGGGAAELLGLAEIPILLTMICLVAVNRTPDRLPKRRDELYASIVDLVLGGWDAARGVRRSQAITDEGERRVLLESTAYSLYSLRRRSFGKDEFVAHCTATHAARRFGCDKKTIDAFVNNLIRDCVLVPLSTTEYGFFHFSVQEYLAARELARDVILERATKAIVDYFRSNDRWWEEVLVFYAGMKRDVSALISSLHLHLTSSIESNHPALLALLTRWVEVADLTRVERSAVSGSVKACLIRMDYFDRPKENI